MLGLYRKIRDRITDWIEAKIIEAVARNAKAVDDR